MKVKPGNRKVKPNNRKLFTYSRKSQELRSSIRGLQAVVAFEMLALLFLLIFTVPGRWRYPALAVYTLAVWYIFFVLSQILSTAHSTSDAGLEIHLGGKVRTLIPWERITGAAWAEITLPALNMGLLVRYDQETRTFFALASRKNLIEIALAGPTAIRSGRSAHLAGRLIINADEPEELIAEIENRKAVEPTVGMDSALDTDSTTWARAPQAGSGHGAPAIKLSGVSRRFGGLTAVENLSLSARRGEILGFVGPNGAGKTTTLKMMTGLLSPSEGSIEIDGHDVWKDPINAKASFGYVPDTPVFYERLTVREHLALIAELHRLPAVAAGERIAGALAFFDLVSKADEPVRTLSLGNRRKLALAFAILHRPPVLLLDEPTNGLDPGSARQVKDLLREYQKHGATVFLTTHILEIAEQLCDRVAIIYQGRLKALGTLSELQSLTGNGSSLEEVFLELTGRQDKVIDPDRVIDPDEVINP